MFQTLLQYLKSKLNETVSQLLHEIPELSKEDIAALSKALESGVIPDQFPPYNEMMDALIHSPGSGMKKIAFQDVEPDAKFADKADVAAMYVKNILLPIAQGKKPSIQTTMSVKKLTKEQRNAFGEIVFDIVTIGYMDEFMVLEKEIDGPWWIDAAQRLNNDYNKGDETIRAILDDHEEDNPGSTEVFTGLSNSERKTAVAAVIVSNWKEMKELW